MLARKICHYLPSCLDDESDDSAQESGSHDELVSDPEASDAIHTPATPPPSSPPINFLSSSNEIFDLPTFKIIKEDDRIVYATALSPPPWHRPKKNMLVYEPAGLDDE